MKDKEKKQLFIGIVIVAAAILIFSSGLLNTGSFAIGVADSDYMLLNEQTNSLTDLNITLGANSTLVRFYNGETYTFLSGDNLYYFTTNMSESCLEPPFFYQDLHIPLNLTETTKICKYSINLNNNEITTKTLYTLYKQDVVQLNVTSEQLCTSVSGNYSNLTCTCPNGDVWNETSTSKVCGPVTITKTVDKEVKIAPTFFEKYGTAGIVFVIMGVLVIILLFRRKK